MTAASELPAALDEQRPTAKLVVATVVGNTIEFYDFIIYGTMTAVAFNQVFFPSSSPAVGTLLTFGAFAVGFFSRPLGGLVFGHFGDRVGRKPMLALTLGIMGTATFLMGLLPSYATIGFWAPLLLTVLRFAQGFGIGGEWGGAVSLVVESAPARKRGFYGSLVQLGSGFGIIMASLTVTILLSVLSTEQLLAWGWRIPFLLSITLVGVGMVVRLRLAESPAFERVRHQGVRSRMPLLATLRRYPRNVAVATGLHVADAAFGFMLGVFAISYTSTQLGLPRSIAVAANLTNGITYLLMTPIGGWLSDRIGRKRAYGWCAALIIPAVFVFFALVETKEIPLVFLGNAIAGAVGGAIYGIQAAFFSELFATNNRYSGISIGFQFATVLGGALMPTVATLLLAASGGATWSISAYIAGLTVITLICTAAAKITGWTQADEAVLPVADPERRT
ncbi:MAG: MFS transporter [Streptosporangiales bacterium]|nr:MFS transporter [Streptosporangiales bacterium]